MKNYYLIFIAAFSLAGCDFNLLSFRQSLAESRIAEADKLAELKSAEYKVEIREVKVYKPYHYAGKIEDPFRVREFLITDEAGKNATLNADNEPVCAPPLCVPPEPHRKGFLENYSLEDLAFVGTFMRNGSIGLIETPDLGVVRVKKGDYMGRRNGKVLAIKETAIVLQEKIYQGGLWKDKKTVLMINK